jgi:hypothetical protein
MQSYQEVEVMSKGNFKRTVIAGRMDIQKKKIQREMIVLQQRVIFVGHFYDLFRDADEINHAALCKKVFPSFEIGASLKVHVAKHIPMQRCCNAAVP